VVVVDVHKTTTTTTMTKLLSTRRQFKEVDRQRALDDVLVYARLVSNLELAERDARKAFRVAPVLGVAPVLAADQPLDGAHAVQMVVDLEERVEHEQLADGVGEVEQLDCQVGRYQVVPVQLPCTTNATQTTQKRSACTAAF